MSTLTREAEQINIQIQKYLERGRICDQCVHLPICYIYRSISFMLKNVVNPPFRSKDTAIICKQYMPIVLQNK